MKITLILGCWGREKEGFVSCPSISNEILDLTKNSSRNIQIKDYLDSYFKLFDRPLYNNVHTAIWNIQDKFSEKGDPVFPEIKFRYIEEFCINHSKCGLFLRLELKGEVENVQQK
jgi:hypothetical protein